MKTEKRKVKTVREYDSNNVLRKATKYYSNGRTKAEIVYSKDICILNKFRWNEDGTKKYYESRYNSKNGEKSVYKYLYDENNNLIEVRCNGEVIESRNYDSENRLESIITPEGTKMSFTYSDRYYTKTGIIYYSPNIKIMYRYNYDNKPLFRWYKDINEDSEWIQSDEWKYDDKGREIYHRESDGETITTKYSDDGTCFKLIYRKNECIIAELCDEKGSILSRIDSYGNNTYVSFEDDHTKLHYHGNKPYLMSKYNDNGDLITTISSLPNIFVECRYEYTYYD